MNRSGRNVLHGRLKATAVERTYVIQRLTQRRVDQVYPLVQLARPHVTLAAWRDLCARRIADSENLALPPRSEEHTSELQSLMRISYAVFCLKKKKIKYN